MTTVEITLPDTLAREAADAGLLSSETVERIPRDRMRAGRIERLREIRAILDADPLPPMTQDEINAEIEAARAELRHASGP